MTPDGPPHPDSPAARLFREPYTFDFFQAVRLLEALHPDRKPVGREGPPAAEVVRFAARPGLAFPASPIDALTEADDGDRPRMAVTFFGLTGPTGVLPEWYTQLLLTQQRQPDNPERRALADWLDLFNHRLLSLFYRAWVKYRVAPGYERAGRGGRRGVVTQVALSLAGLGTPGLADRVRADPGGPAAEPDAVPDLALVRYAGLLVPAARSAVGLGRLLADYFGVPVAVDQFRGRWVSLEAANQTRLGRRGANHRVGESVVVGRRVWDPAGAFRVRVGPVPYNTFVAFLPDREGGRRRLFLLAEMVRLYVRDGLDFDVQLVLAAAEVPAARLTRGAGGSRLGWNTWVGRRADGGDAADAVFRRGTLLSGPSANEPSG